MKIPPKPKLGDTEDPPIVPPPSDLTVSSPRIILYDHRGNPLVRKIGYK